MKKKLTTFALTAMIGLGVANAALAGEQYCREFTQTFSIGNKTEKGYGTACLQPDGSWKIVSQRPVARNVRNDVQYVVREKAVYVVSGYRPHHKPSRQRFFRHHW